MIKRKSEFTGGFLKQDCDMVYNTLVNVVDPNLHAESYANVQDSEMYAEPEFTGKYIDICVQLYKRYGDKKALDNAKIVIESILKNQRADGYLGTYREGLEMAGFGVWNQAFTIFGMLSYYRVTKDRKVLNSMMKSATYTMEYFISGKDDILNAVNNGTEHLSILLPLCELYIETKDEKIKQYIEFTVNRMKNSDLNYFDFESILKLRSRKGIESFVILLGMLKYAEIFDDEAIVDAVDKYWQEVNDTQIRNTGNGTIYEVWSENGNACNLFPAEIKPNETCVAVGWCELSLALFYKRHNVKYLNALDKTLYNHILASLAEDGSDIAYYQPNYGKRVRFTEEVMYKCCRYRGFTLFSYLNEMLIYEDKNLIIPMIYAPLSYESDDSEITVETDYPYNPTVKLSLKTDTDKKLLLRIPEKCDFCGITVNGEKADYRAENGYIVLNIKKNVDYVIEAVFENRLITETGTCNGKQYVSFNYGCVLLAAYDVDLNSDFINEDLKLKAVEPLNGHRFEFVCDGTKNGKKTAIKFCEYCSADDYTVWMPYFNR